MRRVNTSSSDYKIRYYILGLLILAILFSFSHCTLFGEMYRQLLMPKKKEVVTAKRPDGTDSEFFLGKNLSDKWSPDGSAVLPESTSRELILSWPQGEVSLVSIAPAGRDSLKKLAAIGKEPSSFMGSLGPAHGGNQAHPHAIHFPGLRGATTLIRNPFAFVRGHLPLGVPHAHAAPVAHAVPHGGSGGAIVVPAMVGGAPRDGMRPAHRDRGAPPLPPLGTHPVGEGPHFTHATFGGAGRGHDPLRGIAVRRHAPGGVPLTPEFAVRRDPFEEGPIVDPMGRMEADPLHEEMRPVRNLRESPHLPGQNAATGARGMKGGRGLLTDPYSPNSLGKPGPFSNPFSLAKTPQLIPTSYGKDSYGEDLGHSPLNATSDPRNPSNERSKGKVINFNAKGDKKGSPVRATQNNMRSTLGRGNATDADNKKPLKTPKAPSVKMGLAHNAQSRTVQPSVKGTGNLSDATTPPYIEQNRLGRIPFNGSFTGKGLQPGDATQTLNPQQATLPSQRRPDDRSVGKILNINAKGNKKGSPVQATQNNMGSTLGRGNATDADNKKPLKTPKAPSVKMGIAHKAQTGTVQPSVKGTGNLSDVDTNHNPLAHSKMPSLPLTVQHNLTRTNVSEPSNQTILLNGGGTPLNATLGLPNLPTDPSGVGATIRITAHGATSPSVHVANSGSIPGALLGTASYSDPNSSDMLSYPNGAKGLINLAKIQRQSSIILPKKATSKKVPSQQSHQPTVSYPGVAQPINRQSNFPNLNILSTQQVPESVNSGTVTSKGPSSAVISDPNVSPSLLPTAFSKVLGEFGGILSAAIRQAATSSNPFAIPLSNLEKALRALLSAVSDLPEQEVDQLLSTPAAISSLSSIDFEGPMRALKGAIAHLLNAAQRAQILKEEDRPIVEALNSNIRNRRTQSLTSKQSAEIQRYLREQEEIEKNKKVMKMWEETMKGKQNPQLTVGRFAAINKRKVKENPFILNDKKAPSDATPAKVENLPQSLIESLHAFQEAIDKSEGQTLYGLSLKLMGNTGQDFLAQLEALKRNDPKRSSPISQDEKLVDSQKKSSIIIKKSQLSSANRKKGKNNQPIIRKKSGSSFDEDAFKKS